MRSAAVELYERAVIADHSILRHEDHGLAMALLEKYRDKNMPQTAAALCRRGFFENILIGNLEESMKFYEKAAAAASNPDEAQLASDEAKRLREQLAYIREWQQSVIRENRIIRERERQQYIRQTAQEELRTQVNEISDEVSELQERLAFLQKQEKEVMENMYSSMRNAARYRRRYYYPGLYSDATPDPSPRDGSAAPAGSTDMAPGANPYAGQGTSVIPSNVSLNRFYIYRNRARREEDQLAQIRAEISGLQRRVAELQKSSKELREKANPSAVR
jgi:archaellum component FlaC